MGTGPTEADPRLLLHVCCAPDGTVPWPDLEAQGFEVTGFFYGNNIHPRQEYLLRAKAVMQLASEHGNRLILEPYDPQVWVLATEGLGSEPEGGARCPLCFRLQLEAAAEAACFEGMRYLCTTLTISPHKDPALLNRLGEDICRSRGLTWVERIWRKQGGFIRSVAESKRMELYRQNYCGCMYSVRRTNTDEDKTDHPADGETSAGGSRT